MTSPKTPQQRFLDDAWEELVEDRERRRLELDAIRESMRQPVWEEGER